MSTVSVGKPYQKRRRHSQEFKASIVATCHEPGASVSRIALDNALNANLVRRWISESRRTDNTLTSVPAFVPVNLPAPSTAANSHPRNNIRIEIPHVDGAVVVEWPADQAHQCAALLRDLLR
ncbi:Transposase [Halopseudomonas litoralis]|uniref:Transposase n=1 Tax=Halopseudomonas litoralis TaxID=797277 RepID=A0A1H1PWC7_9GAMM|nr:transposase [Halopseudomonas litoralis]SDS15277.1 Transposase [Halopseudomonas litoralis]